MKKSKEGLVLLILGAMALAGLLYVGWLGVDGRNTRNSPPVSGEPARSSR